MAATSARAGWESVPPMTGGIWQRVDAYTWAFAAVAGAMIVAGGLIAAINSATPFAHGSWLAAYLVLVGGGIVEAVEKAGHHQDHQGRPRGEDGMQRLAQALQQLRHAGLDCSGCCMARRSSRPASRNIARATADISASQGSDADAGEPMNICSICSFT